MNISLQKSFCTGIITILLFLFSSLFGASFRITHLEFNEKEIRISINCYFLDTIDVEKIVENGIEVNVHYTINVYRKTGFLIPDELITNFNINYTIRKDIINDGYELTGSINEKKSGAWFSTIDPILINVMRIRDLLLLSTDLLQNGQEYYIETYMQVTSLDLYPPLSIIYNLFGNWSYYSKKIYSGIFDKDGIIVK